MKLPVEVWMDTLSYLSDYRDAERLSGTSLLPLWKRSVTHLDFTEGLTRFRDDHRLLLSNHNYREVDWFSKSESLIMSCTRLRTIILPTLYLDIDNPKSRDCLLRILSDIRYRDVSFYLTGGSDLNTVEKLMLDGLLARSDIYRDRFQFGFYCAFMGGRVIGPNFTYNHGVCFLEAFRGHHQILRERLRIKTLVDPSLDQLTNMGVYRYLFTWYDTNRLKTLPNETKSVQCQLSAIPPCLTTTEVNNLSHRCFPRMVTMDIPVSGITDTLRSIFPQVKNFIPKEYIRYLTNCKKLKEAVREIDLTRAILRRDYPHLSLDPLDNVS